MTKNTQTLQPVGSFNEIDNPTGSSAIMFQFVSAHKNSGLLRKGPMQEVWQTATLAEAEQIVQKLVHKGCEDGQALRTMLDKMDQVIEASDPRMDYTSGTMFAMN